MDVTLECIEPEKMTDEEALKMLEAEYPEFLPDAQERIKAGKDLADLLSTLESFY